MRKRKQTEDKSILIIVGGLVLGIGAGLFFFPVSVFGVTSVFAFAGCIVAGLGLGLMATAIVSECRRER